jgi:hypothetical protein
MLDSRLDEQMKMLLQGRDRAAVVDRDRAIAGDEGATGLVTGVEGQNGEHFRP